MCRLWRSVVQAAVRVLLDQSFLAHAASVPQGSCAATNANWPQGAAAPNCRHPYQTQVARHVPAASPRAPAAQLGQEIHCSDWLEVTQERVNAFAAATGDHQWIHTDPERAVAASPPTKAPIAHGYLTLSLYPMLRGLVDSGSPVFPGVRQVVNYGLDKLRFPNAVLVRQPHPCALRAVQVEP